MLKEVFYFLKGYVIMKAEGKFPERFLNVAGKNALLLWDVEPKENGIVFKLTAAQAEKADQLAERCGCTLHVLGRIGVPFIIKRHRSRNVLLIGAGLFFVAVCLFLSFLWDVQITGNERIDAKVLEQLLAESGIKPGVWRHEINQRQACNEIYAKNSDIAWIGIEIKGICALVEIREKVQKPRIEDKSIPCNLVSDKSGVVEKMIVRSGVAQVKEGDAVPKGTLLVSGIADSPQNGVRYLHADADVWLRIWYDERQTLPLYVLREEETGNRQTRYVLNFFGYKIPLYFPHFAVSYPQSRLDIHGWGILETHIYNETRQEKKSITADEAIENAKQELETRMRQKGELLGLTYTYQQYADAIDITFTAEVLEQAGEKRRIERNFDGENLTD